jgi:YD repeat-containing protein
LLLLLACGCATKPGVIFPPLANPVRWPDPPEPPRIAYVGQIAASTDLKPAKGFLESLSEGLFGKKNFHTLLSPYAVCTDNRDRLFVADNNGQIVHVFNFNTREYQQWKPAAKTRPFAQPVGLAYDPAGRLLVADSVAGVIFVFADDGKFLGELGAGQLQRPCGIAIDPATRRIFVADVAAHQIVVLDHDGQLLTRIGQRGSTLGQFNYPTNVALDSTGRLYVSDSLNFRVQQFSPDLRPLRQIGGHGDLPGTFSQPKGIAVDRQDYLYVVDSRFESVQIFDPQGQLLLYFGEEGRDPGQFWLPAGIFIDVNNRLWIADSYNRRVQVLDYLPEKLP